jgi:hypothetical protein
VLRNVFNCSICSDCASCIVDDLIVSDTDVRVDEDSVDTNGQFQMNNTEAVEWIPVNAGLCTIFVYSNVHDLFC